MKSSLPVLLATCVISAGAGYWFGHSSVDQSASASGAAKSHTGPGGIAISQTSARKTIVTASGATISIADLIKGPGRPDADLIALWAAGLNPADCVAAIGDLQRLAPGINRDTIIEAVLKSWAKKDPQGLLASSANLTVPRLRETGVDAALKVWASQDPKAALQWIKDNPGTASTAAYQDRFAAAIAGFAAADPRGAFDAVMALGDGSIRDRQLKQDAFKSLTDALAEQGRFSDAVKMFSELPTGAVRDEAFLRLASQWAASNPQEAGAWVLSIPDLSQRNQLGGKIAEAWAATDPAGAAAWAAQADQQSAASDTADSTGGMTKNDRSGVLLANAILSWAKYDLNAPGEFLNQLPSSPTKDRGVAIFAMRSAQEDPEGALKWVSSISNEGMRQSVVMPIAIQMYQQDPANFDNFLNSTDLINEDAKQGLKQTAPLMAASMTMINKMTGGTGGGDMMTRIMEGALTADPTALQNSMGPMGAALRGRGARGAIPLAPDGAPPPNP